MINRLLITLSGGPALAEDCLLVSSVEGPLTRNRWLKIDESVAKTDPKKTPVGYIERHKADLRFVLMCGVLSRQSLRFVADNLLHQTILAMTSLSYCRQVPTLPNH